MLPGWAPGLPDWVQQPGWAQRLGRCWAQRLPWGWLWRLALTGRKGLTEEQGPVKLRPWVLVR